MQLSSRPQPAYLVEYQEIEPQKPESFESIQSDREKSLKFGHQFCGAHNIAGANCPNCQKPLLRFLTLDTTDERIGLSQLGERRIHCLFCWTCNIAHEPFYYKHHDDGSIALIEYGKDGVEVDFPYEDYPSAFPEASVTLLEIASDAQKAIQSVNAGRLKISSWRDKHPDLFGCQHQIGGEPFLIQRNPNYATERDIRCPECKKSTPFFVSIADDCLDERGFTENDGVQVIFNLCRQCLTMCAFQQCD